MLSNLLTFVKPYLFWIKVAIYVVVFIAGALLARWHYLGQIEDIKNAHGKAVVAYQEEIIKKDKDYRDTLGAINRQLLNVQRKTDDEVKKPAYQCPIPTDGIGMLNDAIRTGKGRKPSK